MPDGRATVVAAIVALALLFDFTNGFHDAANSIATVVSTRVLTPRVAVIWAAVFNFVAFMVFKTHVANTVGKTVDAHVVSEAVVVAGLLHTKPGGDLPVPLWIVLAAHAAIAGGTLVGGWRIVKTLGTRITALKPIGGFSAETAAATSIYLATFLGVPVSTTHTITGAVVGAGSTRRLSAVRWGVAGRIVWAWLLTIPAAGLMAAASYRVVTAPTPVVVTVVVTVLVAAGVLADRRRLGRRPEVQAGA